MDQPHVAVIEPGEDVLRPPLDPAHRPSLEARGKAFGEGNAKISPTLFDPHQTPALENGGEAPAHGFDFGQFRHGRAR